MFNLSSRRWVGVTLHYEEICLTNINAPREKKRHILFGIFVTTACNAYKKYQLLKDKILFAQKKERQNSKVIVK